MKILVISTLYPPYIVGGAEKAAAMLAEAFVCRGFEVVVISLHPKAEERVEKQKGVRIYRLPLDNFYWPFNRISKPQALFRAAWHIREMWNQKAARRIGRILDIEAPDVVHTHNITGFSVAVWGEVKRRKIRLVHTIHDYYLMCCRKALFRKGSVCERRCADCKLLTWNGRKASEMPDMVVSVSNYTLDHHKRHGYFKRVPSKVIYNIQTDKTANDSISPLPNSNPTVLTFGFIGRIEEEKGIEKLLEATRMLVNPNWQLKIAGRGIESYVKNLQERFTDPRIEWLGFTPSHDFYNGIDVVVIPSQWNEPLPYVCVESLHVGKALICAHVGGLSEIATLSNIVELFTASDIEALAGAMNRALEDLERWKNCSVPNAAILNQFAEEEIAKKYLNVYHEDAILAGY